MKYKTFNSQAGYSKNQYWSLQDFQPELDKMATSVLLHYIQSWGQDNKERCDILVKVANRIGFNVRVITEGDNVGFDIKEKEKERFENFRQEIRGISRGNFESEVVQIARIIEKYTSQKKWYEFWK